MCRVFSCCLCSLFLFFKCQMSASSNLIRNWFELHFVSKFETPLLCKKSIRLAFVYG